MERESFEDPEVAALMNRAFVCIKVDREERPDIDHVYMTVCQMMTGSGGWPLTLLLTPDRRPFFAATYIPRPSMLTFIPRVETAWRDQQEAIQGDSQRLSDLLQQAMADKSGDEPGEAVLQKGYHEMGARFDSTHAGFGARPKFPTPHTLLFLMRYWNRTGDAHALEMVERTLDAMRRGGIHDHVGFGFHRYSTDAEWLVPHFEKMLYDQALLLLAYTEAFQITANPAYRATAEGIAQYVMRDLSSPEGGFYSAEDADSEGEEGKFYVWTMDELRALLGQDADRFAAVYGAREDGNFTDEASGEAVRANILHLPQPLDEAARRAGVSVDGLREALEANRQTLLAARARRVRPHLDDKVLADWNGLMIAALSRAGRALGRDDYIERAQKAAAFIDARMWREGRLLHRYRDGEAAIPGMLEDHAFMAWGLVELYEATFDPVYLQTAIKVTRLMDAHFRDAATGSYYMTADDAEDLLARPREIYDGAVPSGNAVAMLVMTRLAHMTGDMAWDERAAGIARAFAQQIKATPVAHCLSLVAIDFRVGPATELVLAAGEGMEAMRREVDTRYLPRLVMLGRGPGEDDPIAALAPFTAAQRPIGGAATAYLCRNFACDLPIERSSELGRRLDRDRR
jgi:uncharacterized protein YyaL (SSP411 family)